MDRLSKLISCVYEAARTDLTAIYLSEMDVSAWFLGRCSGNQRFEKIFGREELIKKEATSI